MIAKALVILLVLQMTLGFPALIWSQGTEGGAKGKGSKFRPPGSQRKGGAGTAGGQGSAEIGVEGATPSLERLPGGAALSRAVRPDQYVLGPGDGLTVNLWGEFEALYEVRVTPDGKVSLPTLGDLKVKGLTLAEAEALIDGEVKRYYRNVRSGLSLTTLRVFQVSVLGAVVAPGTYLATPVRRVSDLIAEAGGVLPGGSWREVEVRRGGQVGPKADLIAYLREGDDRKNPTLMDDDVLFVPPIRQMVVSVVANEVVTSPQTGQVTENSTPREVELKEGERLSQLFLQVGPLSPWWNLEGVYIIRNSKSPEGQMKIPVDARRVLYERDRTQDIELQAGDQVFIPSTIRRVFVNGLVRTGGAFAYVPDRTAEEYLGLAGGLSLQASLDRSTIIRADGTVEPFRSDAVLFNGDAIQVEQKYFATPSDYVGIIGGLTSLVFSSFAFLSTFNK